MALLADLLIFLETEQEEPEIIQQRSESSVIFFIGSKYK